MTPRPSRPDLRQRKAEAIVHAAASVFAESGLRRARISDIAARAGVGKGTIYEYFRNKDELFLAVFDGYVEAAMASAVAAGARSEDPVQALRAFFLATLETLDEMLPLYPLTLEFWTAAAGSELGERLGRDFRNLYRRYGDVVAEMVRAGIRARRFSAGVEPLAVARVLVGAIDGIFLQAWLDPQFDAKSAGAAFLEVMLAGLGAVPQDAVPDREDAS